MVKKLNTVEEVISELGGFEAVKVLTNRNSPSAVPMWKLRQKFPPNTFTVMQAALKRAGASAPDSLWNMAEATA